MSYELPPTHGNDSMPPKKKSAAQQIAEEIGGDTNIVSAILRKYDRMLAERAPVITDPRATELYRRAVIQYGPEFQFSQAIEELAELIVAIRKYARNLCTPMDVLEEVTDVRIMCEQIEFMFADTYAGQGITAINMEAIRQLKLKKLAKHIGALNIFEDEVSNV